MPLATKPAILVFTAMPPEPVNRHTTQTQHTTQRHTHKLAKPAMLTEAPVRKEKHPYNRHTFLEKGTCTGTTFFGLGIIRFHPPAPFAPVFPPTKCSFLFLQPPSLSKPLAA